jgi:hypothetical protein|tara:strand:- start:1746 stop:1934 length:189 start_codon:yes stop_codon:yes gene_type:complete
MDDTILNIAYVFLIGISFLHGYITGREAGIHIGANSLYDLLLADGKETEDGKVLVQLSHDYE